MNCQACAAAQTNKHSGMYQANCLGCQTRALTKSLGFAQSLRDGVISRDYRKSLHSIFKGDVEGGHARVKEEHKRLEALK